MMPKLPPISSDDALWLTDNPNTYDIVKWVANYASSFGSAVAEECAQIAEELEGYETSGLIAESIRKAAEEIIASPGPR